MRICGIELKGNDAILVGIETDGQDFSLIEAIPNKLKLIDSNSAESIRNFYEAIGEVLQVFAFDKIGIKARATKGKFAGGSLSFKMEGLIQLANKNTHIINGSTLKSKIKFRLEEIENIKVNLYQKEALKVAVYLISNNGVA